MEVLCMVYEAKVIEKQYADDKNLDIRIKLHELYSTNKYGWSNWVFDQIELTEGMRVLELGCGNADFWINNSDKVPPINLFLTDISKGMIEVAQKRLTNKYHSINYRVVDAQEIPFENNYFDIVMANHMIYHIPDMGKAIGEIHRVLNPKGKLYATTMGQTNMSRLYEILKAFDNDFIIPDTAMRFGLETGETILSAYFDIIEIRRYVDSLDINDAEPLLRYIKSLEGLNDRQSVNKEAPEELRSYLEALALKENGIKIKKDSGIFITTKC